MYCVIGALSRRNDDPQAGSRPFDRDRDGFVTAEGAAVLVLEELGHARARGARIYAELVGYGATADAAHITQPDPSGTQAARCISLALDRAGRSPAEVGYVNAHGTGTPLNDPAETRALKLALGEAAATVPVSSTKSMTGHLTGAAGSLEAMITILAIHEGFLPPTINLDHPDPECDLNHVALVGRAGARPGPGHLHVVRLRRPQRLPGLRRGGRRTRRAATGRSARDARRRPGRWRRWRS